MTQYKQLNVHSLQSVDTFYEPAHLKEATADSAALDVVTDFHRTRPRFLESDVNIDEAARMMAKAHVHMKLVVDHHEHFLGIVSSDALYGEKAMQAASKVGMTRADLTVADVMVPRSTLHALSFDELKRSTIGDVMTTLRDLGENHILVLDQEANRICGVVSASDLATYMDAPVEIVQRATSFVDVVKALSH